MHAHEFALYYSDLSQEELVILDKLFIRRIQKVLRLSVGKSLVFFNREEHVIATIHEMSTKEIVLRLNDKKKNDILKPFVQVALALLKREALERALEELTAVGVQEILLYTSQKVQRSWGGKKELERLQRVVIAAAEQSKNFSYPLISEPVTFDKIIQKKGTRIWCDTGGVSLVHFLCENNIKDSVQLVIGPEGDLSKDEKDFLIARGYVICKLTPTVLRACHAASLAAGVVRSF